MLPNKLAIRQFTGQWLNKYDINNAKGEIHSYSSSRGFARLANSVDTVIEGISATGIPVLSQIAGGVGIAWGGIKLFKASYQLLGEGLSAASSAGQPSGCQRTAASGIKSIGLGITTFFPPVGMVANASFGIYDALKAGAYNFVEPLTRIQTTADVEMVLQYILNTEEIEYGDGYDLGREMGRVGLEAKPILEKALQDPAFSSYKQQFIQTALNEIEWLEEWKEIS